MNTRLSKAKLQALLYTDELTQLYNLRYLREQIPHLIAEAGEQDEVVSFFLFDLDDFKKINDNYGHLTGDKALNHITRILTQNKREQDIAIRYAGDEFLLIVPKMSKQQAERLGKRLQKNLAESPLKAKNKQITCECSGGISQFPDDGSDWRTLFAKADEALYVAKEQGKGRIVIVPDTGKLFTPSKLDSILENPFIVGREDVNKFLIKHLSKTGNPMVFPVILGEEGSGKSRMLKHASDISQEKLQYTLFCKGYPFWQNELYGAAFSGLDSLFEQQDALSDLIYSKLQDNYKQILKPYLASWAHKEEGDSGLAAPEDSPAIFEALTQVFFILRETGDGAVLLDDIDQIDPPSLQFFGSQFSQGDSGNLYFVSTISSPELTAGEEKMLRLVEAIPELTAEGRVKIFQLKSLQSDHIQQLTKKLFDGETLPNKAATALANNSHGNPLFIVEALSALLLEGKIGVTKTGWDLSSITPEDIPTSLNSMIKRRISKMDMEVIGVLKHAAILGEKINPQLIAEISKCKVQQVLNALADAKRALLIEDSPDPDEYVFSHRIGRSVLYSLIKEKERSKLHGQAVKIEQTSASDNPERIVGRLAYHFHNAGQMEEAAEMLAALKDQMEAVYISKGMRNSLQKKIRSVTIAKESPLEEEDLSNAVKIGKAFRSSMQNLRLYPKTNVNVKRWLDELMELLEPFLSDKTEVLSLSVTPEKILFNGQPPPHHADDSKLTEELYSVMNSYGLQGILLLRGINREEVVQFLELFKKGPHEVIDQWDEMLEQLEISHILPDRKIFVAVGEHKVILGKPEIYAQDESGAVEGNGALRAEESLKFSDDQMEELRDIFETFSKEKQELLAALESGNIDKADLDDIIKILSESKIDELLKAVRAIERIPGATHDEPQDLEDAFESEVDAEFVEKVGGDISRAFEELSSPDRVTRSKATTWLIEQEPSKLSEAGFKAITSDLPFKFRRSVASIIHQAGDQATDYFLSKITPGMPSVTLNKAIKIVDTFIDNPKLYSILREIAQRGSPDILPSTIEILKKMTGNEVDSILLEIFDKTTGSTKKELISLYAERNITKAIPRLVESIKPCRLWEKEQDPSLQEHICRTLGVIRATEATEALAAVAAKPKLKTFFKAKPEFIRAAATWALTQLPQSKRVDAILESLKKDRSSVVRKAAELSEILRE